MTLAGFGRWLFLAGACLCALAGVGSAVNIIDGFLGGSPDVFKDARLDPVSTCSPWGPNSPDMKLWPKFNERVALLSRR